MCAGTIGHMATQVVLKPHQRGTMWQMKASTMNWNQLKSQEGSEWCPIQCPRPETSQTQDEGQQIHMWQTTHSASVGHRVKEDKLSPNPMYHQTQDFKKSLTTDNYAHTKRDFSQEMSRGYGKLERCEQPTTAEGNIYANPGSLSTGNECDMAGTLQEYSHLNDKRVAKKKKAPHAVVTRDESYSSLGTQK